jgi:hypothetical protein
MDQLGLVLLIVALVSVAVILIVVPTKLSWPERVRWTVLSQATSCAGVTPVMCRPLDLREIVLLFVEVHDEQLTLRVLESGHPTHHALTVVGVAPPSELTAMLCEWRDLQTPMLFVQSDADSVSLHGPIASLTDLRLESARAVRPA